MKYSPSSHKVIVSLIAFELCIGCAAAAAQGFGPSGGNHDHESLLSKTAVSMN